MIKFIATWFYSGLLPMAPGTWGSLASLPFIIVLWTYNITITLFLIIIIALCLLGWVVTLAYTKNNKHHDPKEVVIDEVAGQCLSLLPCFYFELSLSQMLIFMCMGFLIFRLFDIIKPWPISRADHMNTALGVMLDDMIAGAFSAIIILIALFTFI